MRRWSVAMAARSDSAVRALGSGNAPGAPPPTQQRRGGAGILVGEVVVARADPPEVLRVRIEDAEREGCLAGGGVGDVGEPEEADHVGRGRRAHVAPARTSAASGRWVAWAPAVSAFGDPSRGGAGRSASSWQRQHGSVESRGSPCTARWDGHRTAVALLLPPTRMPTPLVPLCA